MRIALLPERASYPTAARAADAGASSTSIAILPAAARFQAKMNWVSRHATGNFPGAGAPMAFPPAHQTIQTKRANSILYLDAIAARRNPARSIPSPHATAFLTRNVIRLRVQTTKPPRRQVSPGILRGTHPAERSKYVLRVRFALPTNLAAHGTMHISKREVRARIAGRPRARPHFPHARPDGYVRHGRQTCSARRGPHHYADGSEILRDLQEAQVA